MLLPLNFCSQGVFCGRHTCCFSPHLFFELNFWSELWIVILKNFWCNVLECHSWNFVIETVYVRTVNWIMASVTERKYFMDWLIFLDLTSGFDFYTLLETVLYGSGTFAQDFVSSFSQSKARQLESIYGSTQDCTWKPCLNILEASWREFVSFDQGLSGRILLISKPRTFARNCFHEVLGAAFRDFVLNCYAIKGFCKGVCFRDSQLFM